MRSIANGLVTKKWELFLERKFLLIELKNAK